MASRVDTAGTRRHRDNRTNSPPGSLGAELAAPRALSHPLPDGRKRLTLGSGGPSFCHHRSPTRPTRPAHEGPRRPKPRVSASRGPAASLSILLSHGASSPGIRAEFLSEGNGQVTRLRRNLPRVGSSGRLFS